MPTTLKVGGWPWVSHRPISGLRPSFLPALMLTFFHGRGGGYASYFRPVSIDLAALTVAVVSALTRSTLFLPKAAILLI